MAQTSTMYNFDIELSDLDRSVYETLSFTVALHPSETLEFMVTRVIAFCLEYEEGIVFSKGVGTAEEPALLVRGLDGQIKCWIEIGLPTSDRLHRAAKISERVVVYSHRSASILYQLLEGKKIHRSDEIKLFSFEPDFLKNLGRHMVRRTEISFSRSEQQLYITIGSNSFSSLLRQQQLS